MSSIADNIGSVTRRIQKATLQAGREPGAVHLLAVSKTRPAEDIREAVAAGQTAFGENYLQEALDKIETLSDLPDIEWHFIGPIQSNKTRQIASAFDWVHSVDRLKIARRLSEQRESDQPPLNICIQININNEDTKAGCTLDALPELARDIGELPNIALRGLMAIPDPDQPEADLRLSFRQLANALRELKHSFPEAGPLDTLSMGMSGDMELAVAEGSTWVRVGTAIFGKRPAKD
ncbi:YggS family pyridoxal phosphate-dependent enzyme [Marinobacter sp. chi1]|uniref:Pyridoxal phosphate homeostasis protein n=1 Tax=Marinobacter suaedae TaxID=3057675 RepID=A0ABT8W0J4_9GAMM|nr:YggS family pyridoxal phosphate-dependent enzyme [Marinobacter sp. chi1]MDO3721754.1 YggS family pyridoxal phosphate-dependent enzyme [Marinobacter sp. chi1]